MAKRKSVLTPLWKRSDVEKLFKAYGDRVNWMIEELLKRTGEEFVKTARVSGNYYDHTGNLRSSIGYVIVKDGEIIGKDFKLSVKDGTDKYTGKKEGEQLAIGLIKSFPKGFILICVAGMKYAAYVEAMENKDVVSMAASKAEDFIKTQSRLLFNQIKK